MAENQINAEFKKLVIIGDHGVGKTSMIITSALDKFPEVIIPVCSSNDFDYGKIVTCNDKKLFLELWDTVSVGDFARLRPLSYPDTDVFLICFSVVDKKSFENVKEEWHPEVHLIFKHSETPIVLVGLKTDLRNEENCTDNNSQYVTYLEGVEMAKQIGAVNYYECSALKQIGLKELFDEVAKLILNASLKITNNKKSKKCILM